jgi:acyl-[acyl-carrier-protein]-phospholipid O-acyltransferase/long-chain-fatty-acid--[acyl-carrier-protein] ligase
MHTNALALLAKRYFLPLFITQFLGAFNDNVFKNALIMLITYRLAAEAGYNAQIWVTMAAGVFIAPFFLFSATAGELADKYEKSFLIPWVKLWEILLVIIAGFGFYWLNVPMLMLVLFMLGVQATFFGPLKYAILPELLTEQELIAGNGMIEAGTFLAILLGAMLGGLVILLPQGEYWVTAVMLVFSVCGWLISYLIPRTMLHDASLRIHANFFAETYRVLQYASLQRDIFIAILGISWFWLLGATFLAEFPVFTKNILNANQVVVTFFFTVFSLGIGLGSLLCNRLMKGQIQTKLVPFAAMGMTLFIIDLYLAANHAQHQMTGPLQGLSEFLSTVTGWRIAADLLLIAIGGGIYTVPLYALLQQRSHPDYRARVIASNNIMNALFMTVGALLVVWLLKRGYTVNEVFLLVGVVNALVAVYLRRLR